MSADNWVVCPNAHTHDPKEWNRGPTERTFREDYEFYGAETGTLHVSYSGHCTRPKCKAGLDYKTEVPITNWTPAPPKCVICDELTTEYNVAVANNLVVSARHVELVLTAHQRRFHQTP